MVAAQVKSPRRSSGANSSRPGRRRPEIPRPLEAICLKAMALTPEDRYNSAVDLAGDLEDWMAGEPVSAWREPWPVAPAAG